MTIRICYLSESSGDWGGASRVLFTSIKLLDRTRYVPFLLLPGDGPIIPELKRLGVGYKFWGGISEPKGRLRYIWDILRSIWMLKRNKINILHVNHSYWRPAEVLAAKIIGIPILSYYHWQVKNIGPFVRYSTIIVTVSNYLKENTEPKDMPKRVIYNSVDLARIDRGKNIREELGLDPDEVIVSFIGQIKQEKGIELFIRLANEINIPNVRFMIAGECRDHQLHDSEFSCEKFMRLVSAGENILYTGYRSDIENIYKTSDIVVVPSQWNEPFGLINIEAGAAGIPVVATRVGGIPEVIEHGVTGYLADKDDFQSLVKYVKNLILDEGLRNKLGKQARCRVEKMFTDKPIRDLENLYDYLVA